jgi:tRNA threonylcarbamoyladenosine biosynthesis protein TsaB
LAVTSSTSVVGVAVGEVDASRAGAGGGGAGETAAGRVLAFDQVGTDRRHAEELTPLIATTLARAGVGIADVEQYVVDVGPGRFTGLRVGLATVRALALAGPRPVIGLTSLEILAGAEREGPVLAVVDARRAEVFQQRFPAPTGGESGPAMVGRPEDLAPDPEEADREGLVIVGDGADRYCRLYGPRVRPGRAPSAATMLTLAAGRAARPGPEVRPVYLREPDVNVAFSTRSETR